MNNAKEFLQGCKKNKAFRLSTDTVSDQILIDFAEGYKSYCTKAENLPISDVVLLCSLDVGDRFAIEDEEDIIGDDYYEVLGKSTTSILCKKPSGRNDRYFPETRVKRI